MKIYASLALVVALVAVVSAQEVEPYGDMTKAVTMVFNEDMATLEQHVVDGLSRLQGVETDQKTGMPHFEKKLWRPNMMVTNVSQMDMVSIKVFWMPPKPPPQKVSAGGSNIKPLRSTVWIVVGCLKTNHHASVVRLEREWTYNARAHIPYTEIPLCRTDDSSQGSYPSDREWVRQLAPEAKYPVEFTCLEFDSRILEVLKTLPTK